MLLWGVENNLISCLLLSWYNIILGPSRRADLEILGYCLLQWACGKLPWEDNLEDKAKVAAMKIK